MQAHFFRLFLHRSVEEPGYPRRIVFTDEAKFTREAVLNSRNSHAWADENPRAARPHGFQELYNLNISAGFLDGCGVMPYLLPSNLKGAAYLPFLEGVLHEFLEDPACASKHVVSARLCTISYFTCTTSSDPRIWATVNRSWWLDCLACTFSRFDPVRLLPVGSHAILDLRDLYGTREIPTGRVMAAAVVGEPRIGDSVYLNMVRRYRICVDVDGRHFESL